MGFDRKEGGFFCNGNIFGVCEGVGVSPCVSPGEFLPKSKRFFFLWNGIFGVLQGCRDDFNCLQVGLVPKEEFCVPASCVLQGCRGDSRLSSQVSLDQEGAFCLCNRNWHMRRGWGDVNCPRQVGFDRKEGCFFFYRSRKLGVCKGVGLTPIVVSGSFRSKEGVLFCNGNCVFCKFCRD